VEVVGIVLGGAALAVAIGIEWAKRPRLSIEPSEFAAQAPVAWTFAAVWVRNKPMPRVVRWFLVREAAQACRATVDFFTWGTDARAVPSVRGRWSGNPEPLRTVRVDTGPTNAMAYAASGQQPPVTFCAQYDPTLDPGEHDVRSSDGGEQVAVAVLRADGSRNAYAWGTESYAYPLWEKPEWRLPHGTYKVVVSIEANGVSKQRAFKLEFLDNDFSKFRLTVA
jgi:hypothetical protein